MAKKPTTRPARVKAVKAWGLTNPGLGLWPAAYRRRSEVKPIDVLGQKIVRVLVVPLPEKRR